jgi:hypothetical protein
MLHAAGANGSPSEVIDAELDAFVAGGGIARSQLLELSHSGTSRLLVHLFWEVMDAELNAFVAGEKSSTLTAQLVNITCCVLLVLLRVP